MWDDTVKGCHTKGKWNGILLLLALILGAMSYGMEHGEIITQGLRSLRWLAAPVYEEMRLPQEGKALAQVKGTVYCAGDGSLVQYNEKGRESRRWETALSEPLILSGEDAAAVYTPGEPEIWLLRKNTAQRREFSAGIDLAAVGPEGTLAAVTAGSGYLTETVLYAADGQTSRRIGLTDQAMVMMVIPRKDLLVSCCMDAAGDWCLRLDTPEWGQALPLETQMVYDLKACGDGVMLWTDQGFRLLSLEGRELGSYEIAPEAVSAWDAGDVAAVLLQRFGRHWLITMDGKGQITQRAWPGALPRRLLVSENRVCALDSEALLVYDNSGELLERLPEAGAAQDILPAAGGLLLWKGDALGYYRLP